MPVSTLEKSLALAMTRAKGERGLQPFLKKHTLLVRNTLNVWAWNYVDCVPEYRFGANLRPDFLVLSADSGSWNVVLVEMKSHRLRPFTEAGVPSRSLNTALRQLDDWERWLKRNDDLFRADLAKRLDRGKVPAQCSSADRHRLASTEITDRRTAIHFHYRIVMGRREHLSQEDQERRDSLYVKERELLTFDRLLDTARRIDAADSEVRARRAAV